jgi:Cation efflux family
VAGFIGDSFALIADGIESLSDVVSSSIVYFGLRLAIKPPDREHPYGHGKGVPIATLKTPTKPSLNAYLASKGAETVSLEPFRRSEAQPGFVTQYCRPT